jgi:hypothetical protein
VAIAGSLVAALLAALLWLRASLRRRSRVFLDRLRSEGIVRHDAVNFFGMASAAAGQIRGSGILVLTTRALHFEMLVPRRDFTVPLEAITAVETPRSFAGKSDARRLLVVSFAGEGGVDDRAGWSVTDLDGWVGDIGAAI